MQACTKSFEEPVNGISGAQARELCTKSEVSGNAATASLDGADQLSCRKSHLRKEVPDPFIDESPRRPVKINGSSSRPHLKQQLRQEEEEEKEESSEPPSESGSEEEVPVQLGRRPAAVQQSRSKPVVRRPNGKPVVTRRSAAPTPDFDSGSD